MTNRKVQSELIAKVMSFTVMIVFLILPYILFQGKFHIGGDDSHLFYIFPEMWLKNVSNSTWTSYSSVGSFSNQYYFNPLLYVLIFFKKVHVTSYMIQNSIFSFLFIGGFSFFKKVLDLLIKDAHKYQVEITIGALIYILSPILLITPFRAYLANIWLVPLFPWLGYLFLQYCIFDKKFHLVYAGIVSFFLSLAFNAVPWLLGIVMPLIAGVVIYLLLSSNKERVHLFVKTVIFLLVIFIVQFFWIMPFGASVFSSDNSVGSKVFDSNFKSTFYREVLSTSQNTNILDPLRNLFHYGLQKQYKWPTTNLYDNWYSIIYLLDFIYPFIILFGFIIILSNQYKKSNSVLYVSVFTSFLVSLWLFTIKIGFLKEIFLFLGNIPGFVMFRNFYDKFGIGYVIYFSVLIVLSLVVIKDRYGKSVWYNRLLFVLLFVVLFNAKPLIFGNVFNDKIRNTETIGQNIKIPDEYFNFMNEIPTKVGAHANIFNVPFGNSAFTIITGEDDKSVFSGKSPVKLFTGINDFSGKLSFPGDIAILVNKFIENRQYKQLKNLLSIYNIGYIFETNNIPKEILNSHLYKKSMLDKQNEIFKEAVFGDLLLASINNNYKLYDINNIKPKIISFPERIYFYDANESIDSRFFENVLNIINSKNILVTTKLDNIDNVNTLEKIKYNSLYNAYKDSFIFTASGENYSILYFDDISNDLKILSGQDFIFNNLDKYTILDHGKNLSEMLIEIDGNIKYMQAIQKYPLNNTTSEITLYNKAGEQLIDSDDIFKNWARQDCNNHNNSDKGISFDVVGDGKIFKLTASNNHNACIYTDLLVQQHSYYTIDFDYVTTDPELIISIEFGDNKFVKRRLGGDINKREHFSMIFRNKFDNDMRIYLYSGSSKDKAVSQYSNLKLTRFEKLKDVNINNMNNMSVSNILPVNSLSNRKYITNPVLENLWKDVSLNQWSQGDCGAVNTDKKVKFLAEQNVIKLQSEDGHNACINREILLNQYYKYDLKFKYFSSSDNLLNVYVDYGSGFKPLRLKKQILLDQWQDIQFEIYPPLDARQMKVYFYSGKASVNSMAEAIFKNIQLVGSLKNYYNNFLVTTPSDSDVSDDAQVLFKKETNYRYSVLINNFSQYRVLTFLEAYHPGWKLSAVNSKGDKYKIKAQHMVVNLFSNGWVLSPENICAEVKSGCTKNEDGSYNIEMMIEFTPQRWFYLGLLISGVTFFSLIGYLGYDFVRRRKKANQLEL